MKINQAFAILSRASNPHIARIITDRFGAVSRWRLWRMVRDLRRGMPVAKIIHQKWFYGISFYTDRHTLDPRPDTETIVESVVRDWTGTKGLRLLDLGTGTGCIAIAIMWKIPGTTGVGLDISRRALRVAQKNACEYSLCNDLELVHASFANMKLNGQQFDVIVSNPPYIARGDKRVNIGATFDPKISLYAGNNGLAAYEQIAAGARGHINPHGRIYVEIGAGMSRAVRGIFTRAGWKFVRADKDLGGKIRVLVFSL